MTSHMALWTWGLLQLVFEPSLYWSCSWDWLGYPCGDWRLSICLLCRGFLPLASVGTPRSGAFGRYGLLHAAAQRRCRDIARTMGWGWVFAHELDICFLLSGEFVPSSAIEFCSRNALNFLPLINWSRSLCSCVMSSRAPRFQSMPAPRVRRLRVFSRCIDVFGFGLGTSSETRFAACILTAGVCS